MKFRNNRNQLKILLVIAIAITLITGLSATYAFFVYREEGSNISLESGEVKIAFANGKNYFNVENSYPVSDETGMILPYYSDFTVAATTADVDIKYEIQIVPNSENTIDSQYIKVYLTDQDDNKIADVTSYNNLSEASYNENAKTVYTSYMTTSGSKDFRLRLWIDESYNTTTAQDFGFTIYLYAVNDDAPASAPVCAFASDYYEWSVYSNDDVEVILECTSESGFVDYEIISDDFTIVGPEEVNYSEVFQENVISEIDNGYRYTLKVLDEDEVFYQGDYTVTLKSNSVSNNAGGNAEASTVIYLETGVF